MGKSVARDARGQLCTPGFAGSRRLTRPESWRPRRRQAAKQLLRSRMSPTGSAGVPAGIRLRNRKDKLRASAGPCLIPWRKGELILGGPRTPERILSPPVSARVERSGSSAARISRAAIADRRYNTLRDTMPAGTPALPVQTSGSLGKLR